MVRGGRKVVDIRQHTRLWRQVSAVYSLWVDAGLGRANVQAQRVRTNRVEADGGAPPNRSVRDAVWQGQGAQEEHRFRWWRANRRGDHEGLTWQRASFGVVGDDDDRIRRVWSEAR